MKLPLSSIVIPERQRQDYGDVSSLAESMQENGQISPILVKKNANGTWELVAGGRRTAAANSLGWTQIEGVDRVTIDDKIVLVEALTSLQLKVLEYEENAKRKDLTWQESCRAVAELHHLKELQHGFSATGVKDPDAWTQKKMADFTGFSKMKVHYMLAVAKELHDEGSKIHECKTYTDACAFLISRYESEVNAEIELRRQRNNPPIIVTAETPSAEGERQVLSSTEEAATARPVVYIHGIPKSFADAIPDVDYAVESALCVIGFLPSNIEKLPTLLRPEGYAVLWGARLGDRFYQHDEKDKRGLFVMPFDLIWSYGVKEVVKSNWPFALAQSYGIVLSRNNTHQFDNPSYSSISAMPETEDTLPVSVVNFSISAIVIDGLAVYCFEGVDPVHICELGRVPIFFEPDPAKYADKCKRLREFYEASIPNVDVRMRS